MRQAPHFVICINGRLTKDWNMRWSDVLVFVQDAMRKGSRVDSVHHVIGNVYIDRTNEIRGK